MPKATTYVDLGDETFGEKLHRAARRCRIQYGYRYEDHSRAISQFIPVSSQAFIRYEELREIPKDPRRRQILYLVILSLGVNPESLGLSEETANLAAFDMRKIRAALHPANPVRIKQKTAIKYREGDSSTNWSTGNDRGGPHRRTNALARGYVDAA